MKKIYTLILMIFISSNIIAQNETDKGYIAITIGPSFPTGDFASTDVDNEKAGLAGTGAIFDLSYAHRLGKNFGIAAMLRGQSNPIDEAAFIAAAVNASPGISWSIKSDPWSLGGIMVGVYGSFPIGSGKTAFEPRLLLGYMSATVPEITITGSAFGLSYSAVSESMSAGGFALMIGGNFRFNVGKKISLLTGLDIYGSSSEFQNVRTQYSDGSSDFNTFIQSFSSVNLNFGIAYRLGTNK